MNKILKDLDDFNSEAEKCARGLYPRAEGATLITLSGELGAGKTAFVKAVAKTLGVIEVVTSPTFVLEKIYVLLNKPFKKLVHIDAYRLEEGEVLATLGFDELMNDVGNLIMLEWPERVVGELPEAHTAITIAVLPDGRRDINYG